MAVATAWQQCHVDSRWFLRHCHVLNGTADQSSQQRERERRQSFVRQMHTTSAATLPGFKGRLNIQKAVSNGATDAQTVRPAII